MILIVGCGFLGSYLADFIVKYSEERIIATVRDVSKVKKINGVEYIEYDVSDQKSLLRLSELCKGQQLTVFYFAAVHNIDFIYENPQKGLDVNVAGLSSFFESLPGIEKMFFASTDCVYGESKDISYKFKETSELTPVNEYGRQKIAAENIVLSKGFNVVRLPFMLGPSLNEVPHFYDKICTKLQNGEEIEMIDGMERSVISYAQAAEFIYRLSVLKSEIPSVVNICADNVLSKYQIGKIIAKNKNYSEALIKKISEQEGSKFFKDKRASCTNMDNTLIKSLLGIESIEWEEKKI